METKRDSFFKKGKKQKPDKNKGDKNKKQERQKVFDENRNGVQDVRDEKKPFDKKAYRLKKYSKKYKLEQWEEQRKKRLMHDYQKMLKNEQVSGTYKSKTFDEDEPDGDSEVGKFVRHPDLMKNDQKTKKDPFAKAKEQFNKVKQDKIDKKQALEQAKQERVQKMQEYKKKKQERFKKLSKKNKKGQPVMTGRLELLLEKIQSTK
ncbi:thyroid transcription factor 1-associated protein 26 [Danaus plexippus plexippus]|uniref:Thyroid transcription factor 1-associated protein 26 n=1 Tax=Danaus plexippus plexippus TaxID=278856 RepID=A0A212F5M4_DANPL|nr:thyroid transcription factor 1-associated protein 26 [Danaus plexippus plexippus]OWR49009.1 thyroid transcription factor 1-associated protein 26 [Danaus plexippus plexippus]